MAVEVDHANLNVNVAGFADIDRSSNQRLLRGAMASSSLLGGGVQAPKFNGNGTTMTTASANYRHKRRRESPHPDDQRRLIDYTPVGYECDACLDAE